MSTESESKESEELNSRDDFEHVKLETIYFDQERESSTEGNSLEPYGNEPLADEEWLERYRKKQEEKQRLKEELRIQCACWQLASW